MAQVKTKSSVAQNARQLPKVARRLIDENKRRRINVVKTGVDFRGRLEKTVAFLSWKTGCNTLHDAMGYIGSELERERFYALYQKLFPKNWEKSSASFKQTGYHEYHTEREYEFIELVSDRYFPLCSWLDWTDFRFDHIPIEPVNFDLCCGEYEWQDFRPCLRFAIPAFVWYDTGGGDGDWDEILESFNIRLSDLPKINRATPPFAELVKKRDDPKIRRFLHLIEFIYHDTGNPFIDTTCCQPVDLFEWTEENLEKLKTDYAAVADFYASMDSFDEDIERRGALATFKEIISIWNTGELPTKKRRKQTPNEITKRDAGLLINILANYGDEIEEPVLTF